VLSLERKLGTIAMPATIDLGLESTQSSAGVVTIPVVTDSEGETEPVETSQATHEESQQ
jgi:hypothetical protein